MGIKQTKNEIPVDDIYEGIDWDKFAQISREEKPHPYSLLSSIITAYSEDTELVILVSTGAFNPIHKMHYKIFEISKEYLEKEHNMIVIAGFISPSHDIYVAQKLGKYFIPSEDRLEMIRLGIEEMKQEQGNSSVWLFADPWESTQPHYVSFYTVVESADKQITNAFPNRKFKFIYLCGADLVIRSKLFNKMGKYEVCAVGRPGFSDTLKKLIEERNAKQEKSCELLFVPLDMDDVSSTLIRERMKNGESIAGLTFSSIEAYLKQKKFYFKNKKN